MASATRTLELEKNREEKRAPFAPRENITSCTRPGTDAASTEPYGTTASKPASYAMLMSNGLTRGSDETRYRRRFLSTVHPPQANGCFALSFPASMFFALGSPFMARAIASFVAREL